MKQTLTFLTILIVGAACGKQGAPSPPVPVIPAAASDLVVAQRGPKVILSWEYPALTTAGSPLEKIDRITLYRYTEELPVSLATEAARGEIDASGTEPVERALFERVPTLPPAQFLRLARPAGEIGQAEIPDVTAGSRVVVIDRPPLRGASGEFLRHTYGVTTTTGERESALSNLMTIVPLDVAAAPLVEAATSGPGGVTLTWSDADVTITGQELGGTPRYYLYRFPPSGSVLLSKPVTREPWSTTTYSDAPPYGSWRYGVTRVSATDPVQESELSLIRVVEVRDLEPPPAPSRVSPLVEQNKIRILWEGVESSDLARYRIYRSAGGAEAVLVAEPSAESTSWIEENASPGIEYVYSLASVDEAGNESDRIATESVVIRR